MSIIIENRYLPTLIPFLEAMALKGSHSRARSKLLAMTVLAYQGLATSERELVTEYACLDDEGKPIIAEDSTFTLADPSRGGHYLSAREELLGERTVLIGDTYEGHLQALNALLHDYDQELAGDDAAVYDHLCNAIEKAIKEQS